MRKTAQSRVASVSPQLISRALVHVEDKQLARATLTRATHQPLPTAAGQSIMCFSNMLSQCVRACHLNSSSSAACAEQERPSPPQPPSRTVSSQVHRQSAPPLAAAPGASGRWWSLGSQTSRRLPSRFAQQQQQQFVVEAGLQRVSSTPSTHGSMAERSGCAPCCMRAAMPSEWGRLHGRCIRRLACSSCEQAGGRFRVSQPLGAPA